MWIGRPGNLREIVDGATSFDRSPDLGVSEFRSLAGGVTTWAPPVQPRRLKVKWSAMEAGDVSHLDRLARRIDAPGPVAVLDPLTRNLLGGHQAEGRGEPGKWAWKNGELNMYGGQFGAHVENSVSVESVPAGGMAALAWRHPYWTGYPVAPGMTLTWWAPGLVANGAAVGQLVLAWYDAAGKALTGASSTTPAAPLVATVPTGAAFAVPAVAFTARGVWALGYSVLALGDVSAALLAGERPVGEGSPAYSITGYSHAPTAGDGRYRDIGLDLVEVTA